MKVSLPLSKKACGHRFHISQAQRESSKLRRVVMVRKVMHRICAGLASQRDARQQSLRLPNAWVPHEPAAIKNFQTEVTRDDIQGIIVQFDVAGALGARRCALSFCFPRGASGRSCDGAPPTVNIRILEQLSSSGRQLAAIVDKISEHAGVESSSLRSYASHLRMFPWECKVFGIDPSRPDIVGIRRISVCVNNYSTLAGWVFYVGSCTGSFGAALAR